MGHPAGLANPHVDGPTTFSGTQAVPYIITPTPHTSHRHPPRDPHPSHLHLHPTPSHFTHTSSLTLTLHPHLHPTLPHGTHAQKSSTVSKLATALSRSSHGRCLDLSPIRYHRVHLFCRGCFLPESVTSMATGGYATNAETELVHHHHIIIILFYNRRCCICSTAAFHAGPDLP